MRGAIREIAIWKWSTLERVLKIKCGKYACFLRFIPSLEGWLNDKNTAPLYTRASRVSNTVLYTHSILNHPVRLAREIMQCVIDSPLFSFAISMAFHGNVSYSAQ